MILIIIVYKTSKFFISILKNHFSEDFAVKWSRKNHKDKVSQDLFLDYTTLIDDERFDVLQNYTLVIKNLYLNDTRDEYTCEVNVQSIIKPSVKHLLHVHNAQHHNHMIINVSPREHNDINAGTNLTITCEVENGYPKQVSWSRQVTFLFYYVNKM